MLYTQTVESNTLGLLKRLMADDTLHSFNLVGGTALSLQIGHRKSIDLDLFTQTDFVADEILQHLLDNGYSPQVRHAQKQTLIIEIEGIKVDFIRFRYPFANDILLWEDIRLADIRDIACMKIDAIMGRGKKKDFCDLYFLLQRFSLKDMMTWYANMFQHSTLFHVFKSLTWFEDANLEGELDVFDETYDWEKAKETIVKAVEKTI